MSSMIPAMNGRAIANARQLEEQGRANPQQENTPVEDFLHAGMYVRTVKIPPGRMLNGALIKIATVLIINGDAEVFLGDRWVRFTGYAVLSAAAGRKQAFVTRKTTYLTMIFPTQAATTREAEDEFTDEAHLLQSRRN